MAAYYNEFDPYVARWLRNLIAAGHIAPGDVDERSIKEVRHDDLRGYTQCHFFAGIGGWSLALRLAGWADDRPVWTGSCPCQPWSNAGKSAGHLDERHLWPAWHGLIRERRPPVVFGEQVAGADGLAWLDGVLTDLEDDRYAVAAADLPAAGVGSPQGRPRLWFVANADDAGRERAERQGQSNSTRQERPAACRQLVRPDRGPWPPGPGEVNRIPVLVNGIPNVLGGCKAYGNAIVPQVAAAFIECVMECAPS